MLIANPIYDTVFKYLMTNIDIAKGVISTIINEEIEFLDFKAQENIIKVEKRFELYHLDFIAKIRNADGTYKAVLIELQKTNASIDLVRFRKYLGDQYQKEDEFIDENGQVIRGVLPIISIYFLGFKISKTLPAVIKIKRSYFDGVTTEPITERNDFIECLTHDSVVIQIPKLKLKIMNRLEYVLSVFAQEKFIGKDHRLKDYKYSGAKDDLMKKILKRLTKAAADEDMLHQLELEEMAYREYEATVGKLEKKVEELDKTVEEKTKTIEEKTKTIEEQDKKLEEQDKKLGEISSALAQKEKLVQELLAKLEAKK